MSNNSKRTIKYIVATAIFFIVLTLVLIYVSSTVHTTHKMIYFSGESALKSWTKSEENAVYVKKTEDFLLKFDDRTFISAKKDGLLWVKDNYNFSGYSTSVTSSIVNGKVYIYGSVNSEIVDKVLLTDSYLYPIECETIYKIIDEKMLFCIEVSLKELAGIPTPITFVNKDGNVVSHMGFMNDSPKMQLVKSVLSTLDGYRYKTGVKEEAEPFHLVTLSQDYYVTDKGDVELIQQDLKFNFYDDHVLLQKVTSVFQFDGNAWRRYNHVYDLEYSDDLISLKSIFEQNS